METSPIVKDTFHYNGPRQVCTSGDCMDSLVKVMMQPDYSQIVTLYLPTVLASYDQIGFIVQHPLPKGRVFSFDKKFTGKKRKTVNLQIIYCITIV